MIEATSRPRLTVVFLTATLAVSIWVAVAPGRAAPRVLPAGTVPADSRLGELRHLNSYFPFDPPETRAAWEARAAELRRRILVGSGLWPMPKKTPLNAVIHGRVEREGFTAERVYFQSYPRHFVTGMLFRPTGASRHTAQGGKLPAVLSPHGHGGRLQDHGPDHILDLIASGDERFAGSGRYPKLARCAQLARMGCVTFLYDMIGYADSVQIPRAVSHRLREARPEMDKPNGWGFFGTQAELRLQSIYGVQTYNSLRALDFLCSLPDVDAERVAVTGGSGGGTQTIMIGALDTRPIAAFPQGMVSTSMQGGCLCENVNLLRIGTGNVELAALFAPRPQGMTAADDWTRDMMTKGYPSLKKLYSMLGVPDNVFCKSLVHFNHNYNYVTRALMYSWFNKHLSLGLKEPIVETDFPPFTPQEWTVWNEEHPAPAGGTDHEIALTRWMDMDARRSLAQIEPKDAESLGEYRRVIGGAFDTLIGRTLPNATDLEYELIEKIEHPNHLEFRALVKLPREGEVLPILSFYPKREWNKQAVIWLDGQGKSALLTASGTLRPEVHKLLNSGAAVLSADLLYTGEFLPDGKPLEKARMAKTSSPYAAYTFGYNPPLFARRVHDVLTLIRFAQSHSFAPERVDLMGLGGAGAWVAAACAQAGDAVDSVALDTEGFRFATLTSYDDPRFLPGAVKYGDVPGLLSLCAPHDLWLAGEGSELPALVAKTYRAAAASRRTSVHAGGNVAAKAVEWLMR
jgi:hypothetical protein